MNVVIGCNYSLTYSISPEGFLAAEIPYLGVALQGSALDWNYTTTNQSGLLNRSIPYERGKVLGGSTVVSEFHGHLVTEAVTKSLDAQTS